MKYEYNDTVTRIDIPEKLHQPIEDYSGILQKYALNYNKVGFHLQVGEITQVQGWILHISVVRWQIAEVLDIIIPTLVLKNVSFKIVQDKETARQVLDGNLGHSQVGKVISIYPDNNEDAIYLATALIALTKPFKGPCVLTDIHLGGLVYTRYGSFQPVIMSDASGQRRKFIYDHAGQLTPDNYNIPFILPLGIVWPFYILANPVVPPQNKILNQIYKPISILKSDAKGNVIKALYLKKFLLVKWCIIKQGKKNMWSDESGRDIPDRLLWQYELHNKLANTIPMPRILDLFLENNDTYLVMEYIKGNSLFDCISKLNNNYTNWDQISLSNQLIILDYLSQMIKIIDQLHQKGYVHRDITPVNFLVNSKKQLVLIDNELVYSLYSQKPDPPFLFGTYGFMSPEQLNVKTPTTKEDIYGLGASMLSILTGISPTVFSTSDLKVLHENLNFFIHNKLITETIVSCLNPNPKMRPTLSYVQSIIQQYRDRLQLNGIQVKHPLQKAKVDASKLTTIIHESILGLVKPPTLIVENLWHSKTSPREYIPGKQKTEFGKSGGFYEGITGVLYFLGRAKKFEFDVETCQKAYAEGWKYITNNYLKLSPHIPPGLYGGAAGIALAMSVGIDAGLLSDNEENRFIIKQCLNLPPVSLDLATGITGQGIAALQCTAYLEQPVLQQLLHACINTLLKAQQKNAFWIQSQGNSSKHLNDASFTYGNAGIAWFLLEYATNYKDIEAQKSAIIFLEFLKKLVSPLKNLLKKQGIRKIIGVPQTWDSITGAILVFIKAYEILNEPSYKKIAEEILVEFPPHIVHNNFAQDNGIAGIGELYLEAYRVFKNNEWQDRADWIAQFFMHTCLKEQDGSRYWLGNNSTFSTADFMVGNSGIIHFLMRYMKPSKLGYRLLI